ncbi:unnamed protein product [Calypogeia fissa]
MRFWDRVSRALRHPLLDIPIPPATQFLALVLPVDQASGLRGHAHGCITEGQALPGGGPAKLSKALGRSTGYAHGWLTAALRFSQVSEGRCCLVDDIRKSSCVVVHYWTFGESGWIPSFALELSSSLRLRSADLSSCFRLERLLLIGGFKFFFGLNLYCIGDFYASPDLNP